MQRNRTAAALLRLTLATLLAVTAGCKKNPIPDGPLPGEHDDGAANRWSYSILKDYYLWNEEVGRTVPDYDQDYLSFFDGLLEGLTTNTLDGKSSGGVRRLYSYIERESASRAAAVAFKPIYGFEFTTYSFLIEGRVRHFARVLYVVKDSPADKAGLRRGDWIGHIDGLKIYDANFGDLNKLFSANTSSVSVIKTTFRVRDDGQLVYDDDNASDAIKLVRASVENNPIYCSKVLEREGRRIAYLVFNGFKRGRVEDDDSHTEYETQLRDIFAGFRSEGVDELILDLRYNPGGYVITCQLLSSLVAPPSALGTRFAECRVNARRKNFSYDFLKAADVAGSNLGLDKIYVIATQNSASASEMLINGLRGAGGRVIHVGERTEGKNVGMELFDKKVDKSSATFNGYTYKMRPITFRVYNARGESNYSQGLVPDYPFDERMDDEELYWLEWKELGDEQELLLAYTLSLIEGRAAPARLQQRGVRGAFASQVRGVGRLASPAFDPQAGALVGRPEVENQE